MKIIRMADTYVLHFGMKEMRVLLQVLRLYPRIPSAHQRLSRSARLSEKAANQRLLDEALAEQRVENKKQLQALLADPKRFRETEGGCRLTLSPGDFEWLLQVLNDVRVGSWIMLGSPEERFERLNQETAPHLWAMEMAGYFQMRMLEAVGGP